MRKIWDFHGGIHPPENKTQSTGQPIRFAGIPQRLVLPLQQHIGAVAKPLVAVGDRVLKGQLLAEASGAVSAPVHAPTSGTIVDIGAYPVPHPSGLTDTCIVLESDGLDQWGPKQPLANLEQCTPEELLAHIRQSGIVGLGGAGFPTSTKLAGARRKPVQTLILNAAECEPYITADDMLLQERAVEVVQGLQLIARILQPQECLIGIEDNKPEAIRALQAACTGTSIEVVVIPTKYPSGGEKQLIKILTGKEVPSGGLPADIGVFCQNVGTAAAVYRAVYLGEPLISRITTVTGDAIAQPCNLEVLLGTPVEFLLDLCGFNAARGNRLIMGGPMMGFTLTSTDLPIVKTSNCIMAVSHQELPPPSPALACIRCGMCAEACPAELLPQQLYWFSRSGELDKAELFNLMDCIECGACSYVCPSSIPLVQYYRHAKAEIRREREEQEKANRARERFEQRQARQERELAEKEAKRKARAEAAAQAQEAKQPSVAAAPDKAAVIQAALERANAKKQAVAAQPAVDLAALEENLAKAQAKLDKMREMLADARENNPEQVEKLENAVRKNEERVRQAQAELDQARATPAPASAGNAEDIGQLERAVARARNKVDTMRQAIETARAEDPARAEKLEESLQSALAKLAEAEQKLAAAQGAASESPAPVSEATPSVEELEDQLRKAEAKLEKMQEALEEARQNNPDNVEKLTRAVEKNQARVEAARQALVQAQAQAQQPAPAPQTPSASLEELEDQLAKAEDKLRKMEQALAEAAPENVEKLTRAVEKNRVRVEAARQALTEAQAQAQQPTPAETVPPVDLEELENQLAKAEDKLRKMEQALAEATPENVEKLTRAVEKNRVRVETARQALEAARQGTPGSSSNR